MAGFWKHPSYRALPANKKAASTVCTFVPVDVVERAQLELNERPSPAGRGLENQPDTRPLPQGEGGERSEPGEGLS
jgi:hypothetical protein